MISTKTITKNSVILLLIFSTVTLLGCATSDKVTNNDLTAINYSQRIKVLQKDTNWQTAGKISLRSPTRTNLVRFSWQQSENTYNINLIAPVGIKKIGITGNSSKATIKSSDGSVTERDNLEFAFISELGWSLPLAKLPFWLKGVPSPGKIAIWKKPKNPNEYVFTQDNWEITFTLSQNKSTELPKKVILHSDKEQVTIKAVFRSWDDLLP